MGGLAGCTSDSDSASSPDGNQSGSGPADDVPENYTVSIPPVGSVEFDSVPQSWAANNGSWADMGIALGQAPPEAVYLTSRYHTQYYDEIPGVSVDTSDMQALWGDSGLSEEEFIALGEAVDLFVMDPEFLKGRSDNMTQTKLDRIQRLGTPFFGNSIFSTGYEWHDYEYLSLYDAFEKLAAVFRERERYEEFVSIHEEFQSNVESVVPSESERPSVAIVWPQPADEPTKFSPYLIGGGTSFKQWRDLGVTDAFAETGVRDFHENRGRIGYETMLDVDPDVIMVRGHEAKSAAEFENTVRSFMENHGVADGLTAVENGDVYRGGPLYQGPITNMVVTERAANQLYDVDRELFDRQRVSDAVNGDF